MLSSLLPYIFRALYTVKPCVEMARSAARLSSFAAPSAPVSSPSRR